MVGGYMAKQTIVIDDEYYIEADDLNWTLYHKHKITDKGREILARRGIESTKEETIDNIGYYGNLRECITSYVKHRNLDDSKYDTLKAY